MPSVIPIPGRAPLFAEPAGRPGDWWEPLPGMTAAVAAPLRREAKGRRLRVDLLTALLVERTLVRRDIADCSIDQGQVVRGLSQIASEKGAAGSATAAGWADDSLFGLIDRQGGETAMASHLQGVSLMVCDDMGTEIADFVAVDEAGRRVLAIHAKAFPQAKPLSAGALHEISSQALKNLGYLQPYFVGEPKNLNRWANQWRGSQGRVSTRIRHGGPATPRAAWNRIRNVLLDPQATREVWLVLGQGLSKGGLDAERQKKRPKAEVVQLLYSLQSTWSSVSSLGARFRVFCSP
jgi:hypothetical protein